MVPSIKHKTVEHNSKNSYLLLQRSNLVEFLNEPFITHRTKIELSKTLTFSEIFLQIIIVLLIHSCPPDMIIQHAICIKVPGYIKFLIIEDHQIHIVDHDTNEPTNRFRTALM